MTVSFDGVNIGDRVRLERTGGDVSIFTVIEVDGARWLRSKSNGYRAEEWDQIEVLSRALPTAPGLYVIEKLPQYVLRRFETGVWVLAVMQAEVVSKFYSERDLRELIDAYGPFTLIKELSE